MHEVLVNRLGGLSLPRKSVVRLTDRPDMTLDVYRGRKTTMQLMGSNSFHREFALIEKMAYFLPLKVCPFTLMSHQHKFHDLKSN